MSMLPSEKRLSAAGWICVAYALFTSILSTPYFLGLSFEHPAFRAVLVTLQLLLAAAAIAAYVNLAMLLNGPFRFRRAHTCIGLAIGAVVASLLFSLALQLRGLHAAFNFSPTIIIGLSVPLSLASGLIHILLAWTLRPIWKVVPRLSHFSCALLCFGIVSLLASTGYWLPGLSHFIIPLTFIARFVTFMLLASVFFRAARMAKAGWSTALVEQAGNPDKSK